LLLGDEINRAPPKTQSALLEAMQEGQVTLEGKRLELPKPFLVIATQNPIEFEGTFPLPEAQVDRFLLRLSIGYPDPDDEAEILRQRRSRGRDEVLIEPVMDAATLIEMREALEQIHVEPDLERYIVNIVDATRHHPHIQIGASPRGSLALLKLARASAAMAGRDFILPDDIKRMVVPALGHRLILEPDLWMKPTAAQEVLDDILYRITVPKIPVTPPGAYSD
jgi:MoxR-like ATPase